MASSDEWITPDEEFYKLSKGFGPFTVDACAGNGYSKCSRGILDALNIEHWKNALLGIDDIAWMNPPYSRGNLSKFTGMALRVIGANICRGIVMLVPAYPTEKWFTRFFDLVNGRTSARFDFSTRSMHSDNFIQYWSWTVSPRPSDHDLVVGFGFLRKRVRFLEPQSDGSLKKAKYSARFGSAIITLERV